MVVGFLFFVASKSKEGSDHAIEKKRHFISSSKESLPDL
jgi:hypothetical protein